MHTIEFPKGSGNNIVLAFESRSECDRFAEQLAESGEESFSEPVTYEIPTDGLELKHIVRSLGFLYNLFLQEQERTSVLLPPLLRC